jgi:hypothetical protein
MIERYLNSENEILRGVYPEQRRGAQDDKGKEYSSMHCHYYEPFGFAQDKLRDK